MASKNGRNGEYTPTQERIMAVFSDGLVHHACQLKACLQDDLAGDTALTFHLSTLRKKLRPKGLEIAFHRLPQGPHYSLVRRMQDPYQG